MYIYEYMYLCIYIHLCIHVYIYIYIHVYTGSCCVQLGLMTDRFTVELIFVYTYIYIVCIPIKYQWVAFVAGLNKIGFFRGELQGSALYRASALCILCVAACCSVLQRGAVLCRENSKRVYALSGKCPFHFVCCMCCSVFVKKTTRVCILFKQVSLHIVFAVSLL